LIPCVENRLVVVFYAFHSAIFLWSGFQAYDLTVANYLCPLDVKLEMNTCFRKLLLKVCRYIPA